MVKKETTSTNTKDGDEEYKYTGSKTNNPNPRTAFANREPKNLTTKDLLIILISTGCSKSKAEEIASNLLQTFDWNLTDLFTATIHELTQVEGISYAKACKIKATYELGIRAVTFHKERIKITSTDVIVNKILPHMKHQKHL